MGNLRDYSHGDILKFPDGTIGLVTELTTGIIPQARHIEDGKFIYLFLDWNRKYYGELAMGYFANFKENQYKFIGNIGDIEI